MNAELLRQIAFNIIVGFLLTLGIVPSEGEDVLEQMDFGPHRVFVYASVNSSYTWTPSQ